MVKGNREEGQGLTVSSASTGSANILLKVRDVAILGKKRKKTKMHVRNSVCQKHKNQVSRHSCHRTVDEDALQMCLSPAKIGSTRPPRR